MLRDEWTWSTQGHNVSHSVKQGKSVHPLHNPQLKDPYLVRADMQRSSQSLRVAFRRDGSVPNWQLGNRSQGWYGGLNGDLPTHTHTHIHPIPGTCECYHILIKVSLQMKLQIVRWDHPQLTEWVLIRWFCCSVWFFATLWTAACLIQWQVSLQETHTGDIQGKMIRRRR